MNFFSRLVTLTSISIASLLAGCATDVQTTPRALPKNVPSIAVATDCGKCEVPAEVRELIRTSYAAAAAKAGVPIANDKQITLTIKDYSERSLVVRSASVVAGPLAFALKDEIKAVAVVDGKRSPLEYNYRNPFQGIKSVAQKMGELSFETATK